MVDARFEEGRNATLLYKNPANIYTQMLLFMTVSLCRTSHSISRLHVDLSVRFRQEYQEPDRPFRTCVYDLSAICTGIH